MLDINEIQKDFNKVIAYSQSIPENIQTDELFETWKIKKEFFIHRFGDNLIYEYPEPIKLYLTEGEKASKLEDFIEQIRLDDCYPTLADFIEKNRNTFYNNKVSDNSLNTSVPIGMKLLKSFKYFITDSADLERIQMAASMIIQENMVEGTLCLSVHPLDFLSMSENNHNWRSCHALDGDYRAGNLSYMVDDVTFMAYIKAKDDTILPHFDPSVKWNSKKWRVLLFLSNTRDMAFAGKQYPFSSVAGMNLISENIFVKIGLGSFCQWMDYSISDVRQNDVSIFFSDHYIPVPHRGLLPLRDLVKMGAGALNFNDVLNSSTYTPQYCFKRPSLLATKEFDMLGWTETKTKQVTFSSYKAWDKTIPTFTIGGTTKCVCCGEEKMELSETLMCINCEVLYGPCENDDVFATCSYCGNRYIYDGGVWVEGTDTLVCPNCAETQLKECEVCGDYYPFSLLKENYIDNFTKKEYNCICENCIEMLEEQAEECIMEDYE